ncbi:NAD(P)H-binding protein [Telmatobacter sp. DSM 110680]|uniref:NAD(P)H-binding protein n=1 Tax=Telmatobacter sp. DSM 110680 TaxID=3036704 RepID=A0AAU7DD15_9BACT
MNVVLYGATGKSGIRILTELLSRNHSVTAVARNPVGLPANAKSVKDDLSDVNKIAWIIAGSDAIVSAYAPPQDDTDQLLGVTERQIEAVRKAGKNIRLIVVGGAGSLEVAPGVTLLQSGHLPAEWIPIATSHEKALELLKNSDINWTYFSPAAFFEPGTRTGKFRLETNKLVADAQGNSRISMEDYAIALVDELETPAHEREQFTIGY